MNCILVSNSSGVMLPQRGNTKGGFNILQGRKTIALISSVPFQLQSGTMEQWSRRFIRFSLAIFICAAAVSAQAPSTASDPVRTVVGRLDLQSFKAHVKGLTQ